MFEQDTDAGQVAGSLRVSTKSAYQWRADRETAVASKGAGGNPRKLDDKQLTQLRAAYQRSGATGSNYYRATTRIYQILSIESLSRILRDRYICPS